MKNFLEKLQSADEATKKRWMVLTVAVIMALVIYVWLAYFNNLIAGFSSGQAQSVASSAAEPASSGSFLETAKNGLASLYQIFSDKIHSLGQVLQSPREYIIKPP